MRGNDKITEVQAQNNEAIQKAHGSDVRSSSWLKIIIFGVPVIAVVAGVIWASTL